MRSSQVSDSGNCFKLYVFGRRISPDLSIVRECLLLGFRLIFDRWRVSLAGQRERQRSEPCEERRAGERSEVQGRESKRAGRLDNRDYVRAPSRARAGEERNSLSIG